MNHVKTFRLLEKAKAVPKEVIQKLPPAYRYQFARIRKDLKVKKEDGNHAQ